MSKAHDPSESEQTTNGSSPTSPVEGPDAAGQGTSHAPGWRRCLLRRCLTCLLLLALAATIFHRPLLVGYAQSLRVDDPDQSEIIVLLMGGWFCRPLRAAELYHQGTAPKIVLGTVAPIPYPDLNETTYNREVLAHCGVPPGAIEELPGPVTSTRDEAMRVRDYVQARRVRRLTVVTTAFHTARARWIFQKAMRGTGVEVRSAAAEDPRFNESNWYLKGRGRAAYLQEGLKWLYYRLAY